MQHHWSFHRTPEWELSNHRKSFSMLDIYLDLHIYQEESPQLEVGESVE
jgi:hypothetical protein